MFLWWDINVNTSRRYISIYQLFGGWGIETLSPKALFYCCEFNNGIGCIITDNIVTKETHEASFQSCQPYKVSLEAKRSNCILIWPVVNPIASGDETLGDTANWQACVSPYGHPRLLLFVTVIITIWQPSSGSNWCQDGDVRGTVVARWTPGQQVERSILLQGHDS